MKATLIRIVSEIKTKWKYRHYFRVNKKTIKLFRKLLKSKSVIWNYQDKFSIFCICISAVVVTRMESIHYLCQKGLAKANAIVLLRVLFEDVINFSYIASDRSRVEDFIYFDYYHRLRASDIIPQDLTANSPEFKKRKAELQKEWDKIKHKYTYTDKKGNSKIFKTWNNKNVKDMAIELGEEVSYNYLYTFLSSYVHLTPTTFNDYVLGANNNDAVIEIGFSDKFIPETLITSSVLILEKVIKVINKEYSVNLDIEINKLEKEIQYLHDANHKLKIP